MTLVLVKDGNIEKALRSFKKKCNQEDLMPEIEARRYYRKPSEVKRSKVANVEWRRKKDGFKV